MVSVLLFWYIDIGLSGAIFNLNFITGFKYLNFGRYSPSVLKPNRLYPVGTTTQAYVRRLRRLE